MSIIKHIKDNIMSENAPITSVEEFLEEWDERDEDWEGYEPVIFEGTEQGTRRRRLGERE